MTTKWKNAFALVVLAALIALVLWITLFSRIGSDARNAYPPFWSYRAIASGSLRILFEVIGNVLLFIPIGIVAALVLHFKLWQTIALGFCLSLLIECSQWFFWLGAFEIDDLLHNTIGAALGAALVKRTGLTEKIHFSDENKKKQLVAILSIVIILLSVPFAFQGFNYQTMKRYAALNDRADGAKNLLILNGEPGFVGNTDIYVEYNDDGSLSITGFSDSRAWKRIGQLTLGSGQYSFSGLSGTAEKTVAIELEYYNKERGEFIRLTPDIGPIEETVFDLEENTRIRAYVGVYPGAEGDCLARPVIYREDY